VATARASAERSSREASADSAPRPADEGHRPAAGPPTTSRLRAVLGNKWVLRGLGLLFVLIVWEIGLRRVNPIFSAPPSSVIRSIPDVVTDPNYLPAVLGTLRLFATGFLIATVIGVVLGLALARFRNLDAALSPFLNALYASPLPAIVPIITAILGYQTATKLLIVVLLAVFPILINAQQGAKSVDATMIEVARSFRVGEARIWRDVVIPASLPQLIVGLRLGAARGMIGTAVAELYTSPQGLGYLILRYGFRFDMDAMLVVVLTFTAISLTLSLAISLLERRVDRWRVSTT
jgi:ABC-type nitrate/sulfonate/bicarbonate transport system permease component